VRSLGAILETQASNGAAGHAAHEGVVRVAVVGATGYAGGELLSILLRHPHARIVRLMAVIPEPSPMEQAHPPLRGKGLPICELPRVEDLTSDEADLVFLATPHKPAHDAVPGLLARGLRVVDLSAAFRLRDAKAYPRWYGFEHVAAEALAEAVYGSPELNAAQIRRARLIANPGCYATSAILALAPLLKAGWVDVKAGIVCDSKSGTTGAGRTASEKLQFVEVNENCRAYGLFNHRHVPEILQVLELDEQTFTFTPHLLPVNRGILSTVYVRLAEGRSVQEVRALFAEFYAGAPLVRVYEVGVLPEIQAIAHTNYADLGFAAHPATRRLIVVSALDNLAKGAAGQAVQNMNLMYGFPEAMALA
jgi:N-acetyl-gamma-glutamyl-phosphate reductase